MNRLTIALCLIVTMFLCERGQASQCAPADITGNDIVDVDDRLAVHGDVDVAELDPEEQVAVEPPDRQAAVHVVVGLPHDEAAQPLLEPGRLSDDDRHRRRADDEGAEDGDNLERSSG